MCSENERIVFRSGPRVDLRPVEESDLPYFTRWLNDEQVAGKLTVIRPVSLADEQRWYADRIVKENAASVKLTIVLRETRQPIGVIALERIDHLHGTATLGWFIGPVAEWGKGYGPEALRLLLDYAFLVLNLRKINAAVFDFNERSKRGLEKCGFREEARLSQQHYRQGRYADELLLALFRADYALPQKAI